MNVTCIRWPTDEDWMNCKQRALVTVGLHAKTPPSSEWKQKILEARHSPIRCLPFSFYLEGVPSYIATHFARHHVGVEKYIKSQRNDRQSEYDRNAARQDSPVDMILDLNGESIQVLANKRLCGQADPSTRRVMQEICGQAVMKCPEIADMLVPMCVWQGGICHEMKCCGYNKSKNSGECK